MEQQNWRNGIAAREVMEKQQKHKVGLNGSLKGI
jgi:hypothetical protein